MTESIRDVGAHLQRELGKWVIGMEQVIHALTIAVVARGHVLLDGPPGLGKTRLSKALAVALGGEFKRVQGTADLMPADITGLHIYNPQTQSFEFQPGPLFGDVLLLDEVNRTGPKTQSALLEAMEERQVTIERKSFQLPENFMVIATRNSEEFEGTFPLPESQLDRFSLCISVPYLRREDEAKILSTMGVLRAEQLDPPLEPLPQELLKKARNELAEIHFSPQLQDYILDVVVASRESASTSLGLSTRGALVLIRAALAEAAMRGAEFATPDDVKRVAPWVIPHRLRLTAEATLEGSTGSSIVDSILDQLAVPR